MRRLIFVKFIICILLFSLFSCNHYEKKEFLSETEKIIFTESSTERSAVENEKKNYTYVLNTDSKKIHKPTCGTGDLILPENRKNFCGSIEELLEDGYTKCGNCFRGEK